MSISFGSGLLKETISAHQINKIIDSNHKVDGFFLKYGGKLKTSFSPQEERKQLII
ncbi:hypothetical protein SSYIS1_40260 (plasmid) [Serratia symbiotica]|uniref:Uncharacterized protein n=1 Tax=Serratia symbiotica TaxID=138074 RepID=A0A455VIV8_9GAMM|nr:hypothetical protein SSYIS1_40260 [Serratia symbiotica]